MASGFLNLLKPGGMTSHDVVNRIRRIFQTRSVGHMGTLDPQAIGVLPVAVGRATRLIPFVEGDTKVYRAEVLFGIATDTYDSHGRVLERADGSRITQGEVEDALKGFEGNIMQVPPMYSAIKVQGKKLYELARAGIEIEREARSVNITQNKLVSFESREDGLSCALIEVHCSKGTYIRSLCKDLGHALAIPSCMGLLSRLASGPFRIEDSITLDDLEKEPILISIGSMFSQSQHLCLEHFEAQRFIQGQSIGVTCEEGIWAVFCGQVFLGLGKTHGDLLTPFRVLAREGEI